MWDLLTRRSAPCRLLDDFENNKLVNCDRKVFSFLAESDDFRRMAGLAFLITLRQVLTGIVARGGSDGMKTMEDVDKIEEAVRNDILGGTLVGFQMWWTFGQKPKEPAGARELPGCGCCGADV